METVDTPSGAPPPGVWAIQARVRPVIFADGERSMATTLDWIAFQLTCRAPIRRVPGVSTRRTGRTSRTEVFQWELEVPLPHSVVWKFVADTDRVNRMAGLLKVEYEYEPRPEGGTITHASTRRFGVSLRWIEHAAEWVEGEWFRFEREWQGGPFRWLTSRVDLVPTAGGTRVVQTTEVETRNWLGSLFARYVIGFEARLGFMCAYSRIEEWASSGMTLPPNAERPLVPSGGARKLRKDLLEQARRANCGDVIAARLADHLLFNSPAEISTLYPYRLADLWEVDRRDVLRVFLYATDAGLFDMQWGVLCPSCRRSEGRVANLADLSTEAHCKACNIRFGPEFDRHLEVTFSPAPLGLGSEDEQYCHFGPMNTPHRIFMTKLRRSQSATHRVDVPAGSYRVRSPQGGVVHVRCVDDASLPTEVTVVVTQDGLVGLPDQLRAGTIGLTLTNGLGVDNVVVMFERVDWADDAVTAADVSALAEFRRLFSSQLLSPGVNLSIRNMVFLFSDLVGSTSLYEEIGDAPALSIVREHFALLDEIYSRHGGTLVKTIGDSIMAVFRRPLDAVRAGLEMQQRIQRLGVGMRVGIHGGPCIATETNQAIDFFGTTVNVASRTERVAAAGEVALTQSVLEAPGVASLLVTRAIEPERVRVQFKGIKKPVQVWKFTP